MGWPDIDSIRVPGTWVTTLDDAAMRKAAIYVAGEARDTDDARELLRALGLVPDPLSKTGLQ
jgi:hypothetical protein